MSQSVAGKLHPTYLTFAEDLRDNPGQWQVYESRGSCVILAGPGSGKTKTLTIKMARMLAEDVKLPRGIACITYSAECARELTRRLNILGVHQSRNIFIGTIHAFCLKNVVLPYAKLACLDLPPDLRVATLHEQGRFFEWALGHEIGVNEVPSEWRVKVDRYRRTHLDRNASSWREDEDLAHLSETYENELRKHGLIDFDDMVILGLQLVENYTWVQKALRSRFPILVVDEYQDLGAPLHRIVLSLCFKAGVRLLAVGDADQSIYGFAGARPELLSDLAKRPEVEVVHLRFNYRSGRTIVQASEITLGETRGYEAKGGYAGTIDFYQCPNGIEEEAERICSAIIPEALARRRERTLGDVAILYTDRLVGDVVARYASACGMRFIRVDQGAPYSKTPLIRWLEDCASWCSGGWRTGAPRLNDLVHTWLGFNYAVRSEQELYALKIKLVRFLFAHRTPNVPFNEWLRKFYIAVLSLCMKQEPLLQDEVENFGKLVKASSQQGVLHGYPVETFAGQAGSSDHLNLITLHSAKGLEFDVVIMMGMDQGRIPSWFARTEQAKREARSLFYVGLTRARHEVHMTYSGWMTNKYGRRFVHGPSEFLIEVQEKLVK